MSIQLTLPEKIIIERMIHQDYTFASIARHLDHSASTVAREVLHC
jgi:IS30 family transposase